MNRIRILVAGILLTGACLQSHGADTSFRRATVKLTSTTAGAASKYTLKASLSKNAASALSAAQNHTMQLSFATGTTFDGATLAGTVGYNGAGGADQPIAGFTVGTDDSGMPALTFVTPLDIPAGKIITITLNTGVLNSTIAGNKTAKLITDNVSGGKNRGFFNYRITPGAAAKYAFIQQPTDTGVNRIIVPPVTVAVQDQYGNTVTSYTSNVSVNLGNNPTGALLSGTTTQPAISGVATYSNLSVNTIGTGYTLIASTPNAVNPKLTNATSSAFIIGPAPRYLLQFTQQPPATATAGSDFAVKVAVIDGTTNQPPIAGSVSAFQITLGSFPGAVLYPAGTLTIAGTTNTTTYDVVFTFNLHSASIGGTSNEFYYLIASNPDSSSAASSNFQVTPNNKTTLVFVEQPDSTTAGNDPTSPNPIYSVNHGIPVEVAVEDSFGNIIVGATDTVTISIDPSSTGTGTLTGTLSADAGSDTPLPNNLPGVPGIAQFDNLNIDLVGTYRLRAAAANLTMATSNPFQILPDNASTLVVTGLSSPSIVSVPTSITVTAKDDFGNIDTGYKGQIHFSSTDAQAVLPGDYTFGVLDQGTRTFANGVTFKTPGNPQTVTAVDPPPPAALLLTGSQSVLVTKGDTSTTIIVGFPSPSQTGTSVQFVARVSGNASAGTPTGTMTFNDNNVAMPGGVVAVQPDGTATLNINSLSLGSHPITAAYSGDVNYNISTSTLLAHKVVNGNSVTTLTAVPTSSTYGGSVTLIATVTPSSTTFALTGTVAFKDGNTVLSPAVALDLNHQAAFQTTALLAGTRSIQAVFSGDDNYAQSASAATQFVVNKATLTVTANNTSKLVGAALPTLTASYSGFKNGETPATSGVTGSPALSTTATVSSPVGSYPITAATGTLGSSNYSFTFQSGTLSITPLLSIDSGPAATPNPALVGETVQFSCATNLPGSTYTWDFGDGAGNSTGSSVAHVYAAVGAYQVTVTATNGTQRATGSITVIVQAGIPASPPPLPMTILTKQMRARTPTAGKDTLSLTGILSLPEGKTSLAGKIELTVGSFFEAFTLNTRGMAKSGSNSFNFNFKGKTRKGVLLSPSVAWRAKLIGDFVTVMEKAGLPPGTSGALSLPVQLTVDGTKYGTVLQMTITGTPKSMKGK